MTTNKTTIGDFCRENKITIFIIKYYCRTFDIDLFSDKYLVGKTNGWLSDSTVVSPRFIEYFTNFKKEVLEYEQDYYFAKSMEDIALKINVDILSIVRFFNKNKPKEIHQKLSEDNEYISKPQIKKTSSYQILKDIQLENRMNLITKISKN